MRLIDADAFIDDLGSGEGIAIGNIRKMVETYPTAYNLDKVVNKLEEHKKRIMDRKERDILNVVGKTNAKVAVEEDIEIVKSGMI